MSRGAPVLALLLLVTAAFSGCGATSRGAVSEQAAPGLVLPPPPQSAASVVPRQLRRLIRLGLPVYCGGRRRQMVALTFDDGPGSSTPRALRALRRAHARATFFLVGSSIVRHPLDPSLEAPLGALGDHTARHADLLRLPPAAMAQEIRGGAQAIQIATGQVPRLFRPPYGARDLAVDREISRQGMVEIVWDVDSGDSDALHPHDARGVFHQIIATIRPGSIVLMHENRGQTVGALRLLLPWLHRHHLRPVAVPALLAADPPSLRQLQRGDAGCAVTARRAGA